MPSSAYLQQVAGRPGNVMPQFRPTHAFLHYWQTLQDGLSAGAAAPPPAALRESGGPEEASPAGAPSGFDWSNSSAPASPTPPLGRPPAGRHAGGFVPAIVVAEPGTAERASLTTPLLSTARQAKAMPAPQAKPEDVSPELVTPHGVLRAALQTPRAGLASGQREAARPAEQSQSVDSTLYTVERQELLAWHPPSSSSSATKPQAMKPVPAQLPQRPGSKGSSADQPGSEAKAQRLADVESPLLRPAASLGPRRERDAAHTAIQIGTVEIRITAPAAPTAPASVGAVGPALALAAPPLARGFASTFGLRQS